MSRTQEIVQDKPDVEVVLPREEPVAPSSPVLDERIKKAAFDYGMSLDSKKIQNTIDSVDLENMC